MEFNGNGNLSVSVEEGGYALTEPIVTDAGQRPEVFFAKHEPGRATNHSYYSKPRPALRSTFSKQDFRKSVSPQMKTNRLYFSSCGCLEFF